MIDRRKVYLKKWPGDKDYDTVAIGVHISNRGELCYLTPPDRPHMIPGKIGEETDDGFTWISTGAFPGEWIFKVLTTEAFKRKYYKIVMDGETLGTVLKTTDNLHKWYRREFKIY